MFVVVWVGLYLVFFGGVTGCFFGGGWLCFGCFGQLEVFQYRLRVFF